MQRGTDMVVMIELSFEKMEAAKGLWSGKGCWSLQENLSGNDSIRILSFNYQNHHCHLDCLDDYAFEHYTSPQPETCRATHELKF